ncbi:coiled-coil domain-containing protein [Pedobacter yulinensis]|uniref:hypothetical protein n=1 Tax=Pedobacter yulinensis TaxID=2126353 RepID=UPI0013A62EF8|nr:hypothetical protein [Pedobacter yulinensis]
MILIIVALVGTNIFLFLRNDNRRSSHLTIINEKEKLRLELAKIEIELDKVTVLNVKLSEQLISEQQKARVKIAELKLELQKARLNEKQLAAAKSQISGLRTFVKEYNKRVEKRQREIEYLREEMDSLQASAAEAKKRAAELENRNRELNSRIRTSAALKASEVRAVAFRQRDNGRKSEVTRASTANIFRIEFTVIPNPFAEGRKHRVYLRVFDPAGNLIADDNNMFEANGQQMQYSLAELIDYQNDGGAHVIDWKNPGNFVKGTYTLILYSGNASMGKTQITLR